MSRSNYIFTGARGSGKSFAARALARRRECYVFIDPTSTISSMTYTDTDPRKIAGVVEKYNTFDACLWVGHLQGPEFEEALRPIIAAAERKKKWVTIIIDEVGVITPGRAQLDSLERSARMGRHSKVSYWFISQRSVDVSQNLRAQCERQFCFRTGSARDVEQIKRDYGKEAAEALSRLPKHHYLIIDTQTRETSLRAPIKAPGMS